MRRRFFSQKKPGISNKIEYFTIEALEDGLTASLSSNNCEYRVDNGEWKSLAKTINTVAINKGQTLSFKGNLTPTSSNGIGKFAISNKCNLKGNIMSLLYGDDFVDKIDLTGKDYAFFFLFNRCTNVIEAHRLVLPAITLSSSCYESIFNGCTNLTTAPELPATTLAESCYYEMFMNCTSLTTAPELPATTLSEFCYSNMFYGCTSLTTAPELPATTLADYCYNEMFSGTNVLPDCSNIDFTNETVVSSCGLTGLFAGTKVTDADLERILPKNSNGKYCLPAITLSSNCYASMFNECTGLTTAPELPATTLASYCYLYMFNGCTGLTSAPELPATTLASSCYSYMFYGCKQLNYIKMLATNISASRCLSNWVNGVSNTGTFVKHPDMTTLPTGANGIPEGWTVVDNVERNLITFTIAGVEYQAEEGMTWGEWVDSEYNTDGCFISSDMVKHERKYVGKPLIYGYVYSSDKIEDRGEYIKHSGGSN